MIKDIPQLKEILKNGTSRKASKDPDYRYNTDILIRQFDSYADLYFTWAEWFVDIGWSTERRLTVEAIDYMLANHDIYDHDDSDLIWKYFQNKNSNTYQAFYSSIDEVLQIQKRIGDQDIMGVIGI